MNLIREATTRDTLIVANNLRTDDRNELEGMGESILHLPIGVMMSDHAVSFYSPEGEAAGIAGIIPLDNKVGKIWMLCTPVIETHPFTFVRSAKKWLNSVQKEYKLLWNLADSRNPVHHKLLKHLGFKALRTVPVGPTYIPYYEIVKLCAQ